MQSSRHDPRSDHLVSAAALAGELGDAPAPVLLDVRWSLRDEPGDGRGRYDAQHLPGARFLDLESVLTCHSGDPMRGRHPLPDPQALAAWLARLGVGVGDGPLSGDVVVYDEPGTFAAERAWWVLRWAGLRARLLDGGLTAWLAAGLPTEASPKPASDEAGRPSQVRSAVPPTLTAVPTGQLPTLTADEAATLPQRGVLLDARAPERFRGEVEPLDPRPGHIPGAVNLPAARLYEADGRLPGDAQLAELLAEVTARPDLSTPGDADAPPVGVYCGSGVSAARTVLAFAAMGRQVALFPGSWSAWSNDPTRPAATGP